MLHAVLSAQASQGQDDAVLCRKVYADKRSKPSQWSNRLLLTDLTSATLIRQNITISVRFITSLSIYWTLHIYHASHYGLSSCNMWAQIYL